MQHREALKYQFDLSACFAVFNKNKNTLFHVRPKIESIEACLMPNSSFFPKQYSFARCQRKLELYIVLEA